MITITYNMNLIQTLTSSQKKHIKYIDLAKDTTIFHENDECKCIGIVIEGEIRIISYLENGKEIIYNTIKQNECFGTNLLFSSNPYYKGNVISLKQSKIALIYSKNLLNFIQNNKKFMIEYLKSQANFTIGLNETIKILSIENAKDRFLYYMHVNGNVLNYHSVSDLAKKLHLQRETLSRLLSKLEKKNKIKRDKGTITIL